MQSGDSKKVVRMFYRMNSLDENLNIWPDAVSLCNRLPAFVALRASMQGKEVHGYAVRTNLVKDLFVGNAIVDMYAKCGLIDDAHKVFRRMEVKDVVSWNAMVTGLSQIGRFEDPLALFEKMRGENITWSAVIAGYTQRGYGYEALDVFGQMVVFGSSEEVKRKTFLDFCIVYKEKGGVKILKFLIFFVNQKLVLLHRNKFMFTIFEINLVLILPVAKCLKHEAS
ncbi:putative tetratricopeptide-like helical domain superfamily [Helianthus annuus]|nr:putative tetratricopeptide-like helical domain superfamily [Helianthus annuus]KAJ0533545.1 putative tetratricopeptide-like helical domain superfamily [Helianthus annuus]KAJ0541816.1 putative tetratricopeptide-like helical domain superfamily [Helianthus annuus]KAJ0706892.1 putative tetratricopeptide-like helical domain superfamily [Helianthus annuus]KAJ0710911.1 putative tetratricopeptide-like helical domain superfamily [Helianthus annuus]